MERLTPADRIAVARVLADAFRDYPYMSWVLEAAGTDYEARLEVLTLFMVDVRYAGGHPVLGIRESGRLVGAATVESPEPAEHPRQVERLLAGLRRDLGDVAFERMALYEARAHLGRPEKPVHHLDMLAVAPQSQGRGYGGRLVEAVKDLARVHPTSVGVGLNTEVASNAALYEHLGFAVVGEADIGPLHTWSMFWPCGPPPR